MLKSDDFRFVLNSYFSLVSSFFSTTSENTFLTPLPETPPLSPCFNVETMLPTFRSYFYDVSSVDKISGC